MKKSDPSGPPQNVRAITKTSSSIILYWLPLSVDQQNGEIRRYNIKIRGDDPFWHTTINTKNNLTTLLITGLQAYTNYKFEVQAVNDEGVGPYSSPVISRTFEAAPSPPVNIVAKTINSAAIKVTWQTPLYPNGEINYRLYYWLSSEGVGTKRLAYNGPSLEHTVAGLQEFLTYTLMLQAYNATETIRPAEPSGPPLNVKALKMSPTSILVEWSPPSELDRNGVITHYIVNTAPLRANRPSTPPTMLRRSL